jgi:tRNA-Thr(GGU) m(6)t(6)A37 methyltransferase TsaA
MIFKLYPVGVVENKNSVHIRIFERYKDALKGLDGFSHAFVFYWFDRNDNPEKRSILQVYPRGNRKNPLTGVFACRTAVRPNLIAFSVCKIVSIKENLIHIEKIDALDQSPVLDIKPYIPGIDNVTKDVRTPEWVETKS